MDCDFINNFSPAQTGGAIWSSSGDQLNLTTEGQIDMIRCTFVGNHDLPRIIRAGKHLARTKRYSRGLADELEDESQLPAAVVREARRGDGWIKLVGD